MAGSDRLGPPQEAPSPNSEDARSEQAIINSKGSPVLNEKARQPSRKRWILIAALSFLLVALALGLGLGLGLGLKNGSQKLSQGQTSKPNVLVVMADDQDLRLDSMSVMPNVNKWLGDGGVRYENHYCTVAWCCPSRVNFFTGRAAHNTNVTDTKPPYGGWDKFGQQGLNDNYLPVWINESGISTYYAGKFLNGYGENNFATPAHPKGWTMNSFLVGKWTYIYYHSKWLTGYTSDIEGFPGVHTTQVTQDKGIAMIDHAADSGKQFFMMLAPVAPHQQIGGGGMLPPIPDKYKGVFDNRKAPRTPNFNPDERSGASWVYNLDKLSDSELVVGDKTYYHRLGNIAALDDMMLALIERLEGHGILDNTYVIYTSDNGFHIGNHRLQPGKRCPYEEDVNVPLLIRGPNVPQGVNTTITNSHTDIAPTILQMLGVPLRDDFDGAPIAYTQESMTNLTKNEIVQVEFWGGASNTNHPLGLSSGTYYNNTYKALRMLSDDYNLYYSTWCTGEHEFYDMKNDVYQMTNFIGPNATGTPGEYYGRPLSQLTARMDAVMMVTKSCKADSCRNPWGVLFPKGEVTNLKDSMSTTYDTFFANQPKVSFEECTPGYIVELETPLNANVFTGGSQKVLS